MPRRRNSGRTTPIRGAVVILSTHETEREAIAEMQRQARNIRRRKVTSRYGVFVEKTNHRNPVWWVCLRDRGTK